MLPYSGYDVGILRLFIKVLETLDVCEIFLFICVLREGDANMFASNPLVKVVFNLYTQHPSVDCHKDKPNTKDLQQSRQGQ